MNHRRFAGGASRTYRARPGGRYRVGEIAAARAIASARSTLADDEVRELSGCHLHALGAVLSQPGPTARLNGTSSATCAKQIR
jgi:hypothetical protein